jgi:hypothetical protein
MDGVDLSRSILERFNRMSLPHLGDILAIPFFLWLVIYFYRKSQAAALTNEEKILYLFCIGALIADTFFVCCLQY